MNLDTIIGILFIAGLIYAVKLIDKPRRGKQKDKYLVRIEDEFENSLDAFANKTLEQMNTRYGLNIKLLKLTTELDFVGVDENK